MYNVVVISDLHLGEDLSVDASDQTRRDVAMASAAGADFVAHLTQRRADSRPWRLVINGDFLDFMSVHVSPVDPRLDGVTELGGLGRGDRLEHGAGRVPAASAIRVDLIAEQHPVVFRALARFLAAGNQLDIVAGNHDREITHPLVAERVRAALRALGARERDLSERLAFHDWFVHEPGVAWIEHGHQYDEQCSFEHGLAPEGPRGEIIPNVDACSTRYLSPVAAVDVHATEEWTFGGYMRFAMQSGMRGTYRLLRGYAGMVRGLWASSRAYASHRARRRRTQLHEQRLAELADERGLPVETLRTLHDLRRTPITSSLRRVCRMLFIDRMALSALSVIAALALIVFGGWPWGFVGGALALLGGHFGGEAMATRIPRDPSMALAIVPERIHRAAQLPVVVFGHTHQPMRLPLSSGGVYINGGTWLPAIRPGLLRAFTHVVILRGKSGPEVHLRQWRDGRSRPFDGEESARIPGRVPTVRLARPRTDPAIDRAA